MTTQPRTQEEIYTSLETRISGSIPELTDWSPESPNYILVHDGYAEALRRTEIATLATQLSAWVDYAGGPVTKQQLEDIGVDTSKVDIELLNTMLNDSDLDQLAIANSVTRDPGNQATGQVTFTVTDDSVTISEGTEVATQPDSNGNYLSFFTDSDASPNESETTVTVDVTAEETGSEYNVGSDTITYLPSPPVNVQSVTNNNSTSDGEDPETNDELRARVKDALVESSGGGTTDGIEGGIVSRIDSVTSNDVFVEEFFDPSTASGDRQDSPYIDVIVDGGIDSDVETEIEKLRPAGIRGYLVRPTIHTIDVTVDVEGSNIDTSGVEDEIVQYLNEIGIGDNLYRDVVIQTILNADSRISNIAELRVTVAGEVHTYDTSAPNHPLYELDKGDEMSVDSSEDGNGIVEVRGTLNGVAHTFTEGTDYDESDVGGDGTIDAIDWGLSGDNPDEDTDFEVDYDIKEDITISQEEKVISGTVTVNIV